MLASAQKGERLREGLNVVIAGPPNVGKSTLMNALSKREVSIVSSHPGTTRDLIEVALDLGGYPLTLVDTAGIRPSDDEVELEGIERARRRAKEADLTLWLVECGAPPPTIPEGVEQAMIVLTKSDRIAPNLQSYPSSGRSIQCVSAMTGDGITDLLDELTRFAESFCGGSALITTERHRIAFSDAETALVRALDLRQDNLELLAEDLRLASRALARVSGRIDVEDVLEDIFARMCVGK